VILAIATVGVLVRNAVGGFSLAHRVYLILSALWQLFAALAVLATFAPDLGRLLQDKPVTHWPRR
jgi:hypothetical protein